ncbi:MAG: ABC transporter substrate-binding protein [Ilumatobacteraceae bacterium]
MGAAAISLGLVAAACSDKKDESTAVTGGGGAPPTVPGAATTTAAGADTTAGAETTSGEDTTPSGGSEETTPPDDTSTETTTDDTTTDDTTTDDTTETTDAAEAVVQQTLPAPEGDPVPGGRLVIGGEAEVGSPWTPAASQCDSFCQMRARSFYDPLIVVDQNDEAQPFLLESIEPNEDSTVWTLKVREGISFTDGTPLNADAVMDNINRSFTGLLIAGAVSDTAKNADGTVVMEKLDDFTFTIATGKNGDINEPVSWYLFPYYLAGQGGFMASPTWLAAVDADPALATQPVGTGPFMVAEYLPGDRLRVTKNPNYWRQDEAGNQLPYLDEIEFRVIVDSQTRAAALQSGDVDMIATSDPSVVGPLSEDPAFTTLLQNVRTETGYLLFHLTQPVLQSREVRCALNQAIDKQDLVDVVYGGYAIPSDQMFTPGQDGYLEDNGAPGFDPAAAAAAIEAYEAANGPVTVNYSTVPTGTNRALADYFTQKWAEIGVDTAISTIEQSQIITDALFGAPGFGAFAWRNHAGLFAETQYFWWHGFASDAYGKQTADGELSLNFGRQNDPVINDLLDQLRITEDEAERTALAQEVNRQFATECWTLPIQQTQWGIHLRPGVANIGRDPLPDGGFAQDGAGFPGQVWLASVFLEG